LATFNCWLSGLTDPNITLQSRYSPCLPTLRHYNSTIPWREPHFCSAILVAMSSLGATQAFRFDRLAAAAALLHEAPKCHQLLASGVRPVTSIVRSSRPPGQRRCPTVGWRTQRVEATGPLGARLKYRSIVLKASFIQERFSAW
jgi:hypothetical protein